MFCPIPLRQWICPPDVHYVPAMMFEARVGQGRFMVACIDWKADMENRPATQQLFRSVGRYMQSSRFDASAASLETDAPNAAIRQLLNK